MKEIKLTENFYMYSFDPTEKIRMAQNIFVLYSGSECVVFDAGYEYHMNQLKIKLDKYTIKYVILTHFHPDHCYGLNVLDNPPVIGSEYGTETLKGFDDNTNKKLLPSITISDELSMNVLNHTIYLKTLKGHSKCGLSILIDNEFLLTGDDIMSTNEAEMVIPFVGFGISAHRNSLNYIKANHSDKVLLLSHGAMIEKNQEIKIDKRLKYLDFLETKEADLSLFYSTVDFECINEDFHPINISIT